MVSIMVSIMGSIMGTIMASVILQVLTPLRGERYIKIALAKVKGKGKGKGKAMGGGDGEARAGEARAGGRSPSPLGGAGSPPLGCRLALLALWGVGWCLVGAKLARASLRQRYGGQGQACAQG